MKTLTRHLPEKRPVGRPIGSGNIYVVTFPNQTFMTFTSRNQLSKTLHVSPNIITKSLKENHGMWHGLQFCLINNVNLEMALNKIEEQTLNKIEEQTLNKIEEQNENE